MKVTSLQVTRWIGQGLLCFLQLFLEREERVVKTVDLKFPSSCLELEDDEGERR